MAIIIDPHTVAIFLVRILLGILFFFQGFDKIFGVKMKAVIGAIEPSYQKIKLPPFMVVLVAYFTSFAELLGGLCLIAGVLKYASLYLLGVDLLIVSVGMSLLDPVWKMELVFPRFIMLVFVLVFPAHYDTLTLSHFLFR